MVTLASLWLPILLSAVIVFIASSVIHMLLPYHQNDFAGLPNEEAVKETLRASDASPGDYVIPHAVDPKDRKSPEYREKMRQGPVVFMTFLPDGPPAMGKTLALWFVFCIVVGIFAAYVSGRVLPPGSEYLSVFQIAGTTAFVGYALALWEHSIWYGRKWSSTLKSTFDGLVYGLLTGGVFGWLWPGA